MTLNGAHRRFPGDPDVENPVSKAARQVMGYLYFNSPHLHGVLAIVFMLFPSPYILEKVVFFPRALFLHPN